MSQRKSQPKSKKSTRTTEYNVSLDERLNCGFKSVNENDKSLRNFLKTRRRNAHEGLANSIITVLAELKLLADEEYIVFDECLAAAEQI